MSNVPGRNTNDRDRGISRRRLLQTLGVASVGMPLVEAFSGSNAEAQGRCMLTLGAPSCDTSAIKPIFEPTGWNTVALEQVTFRVADYQKEAAFYAALMGWTLRSDDGKQAVMDLGDWGTAIFKQAPASSFEAPAAGGGGGRGGPREPVRAVVESFGFAIDQWNAKKVESELTKRGLTPVADNKGAFESFHVKDPDGFDVQISNTNGHVKDRKTPSTAKLAAAPPFESTGWKTVWLDHFSFGAANYKASVSFYTNLLGWQTTYDEGSQNECMIGEIGDIIIRGGNPLDPEFGKTSARGGGRIDHISFGIAPWDTDGVKADLEKRGLKAQIDTSNKHQAPDGSWVPDEIHTAAFKSYHTITPNGYNLQISYVTHDNRLALANAVKPRKG